MFWVFLEKGKRKVQSCLGDTGGRGFHLVLASFQKSQNCRTLMGGQEGDALQRRRFSSAAHSRDTLRLLTRSGAPFLGITALTDSKRLSLADSRISMLCVCISYLRKKKKRKTCSCRALSYVRCDRNLFTILPIFFFLVIHNQCMPL